MDRAVYEVTGTSKVKPPSVLTTPIIAFSRVRDSVEAPPDELLLEAPPDPGIPVVVMVVIANAGSTWDVKSEYGEGSPV